MTDENQPREARRLMPEQVASGVPGLDSVLHGGPLRGASYLILGEPGTGKTILGNQFAYSVAANDGVALYITVLAEAHDRMLMHLADFDFFNPEFVGRNVHYLSLVHQLGETGLTGALGELRRLVRMHGASLLVIDGASRFEDFAVSRQEYLSFVAQLGAELAIFDCTTLLLAQPKFTGETLHSIGTLVDGIFRLEDRSVGVQNIRLFRMSKHRGASQLGGLHEYAITSSGIEVYPRLEAIPFSVRPERPRRQRRLPFGIDGLDSILQGGLLTGSSTLIAGPPGIGKTTLGVHFVAEGAHRDETGLIASFGEAPDRLVAKAEGLGLDLEGHVQAGRVHILWQPMSGYPLDAWAGEIMTHVAAHQPQRLVIDGLTELARLTPFNERLPAFLAALGHTLRMQGVTSIITAETTTVEAAGLDMPFEEAAAMLDNALLLRYVEPRSRLHRLISILRVRESGFDPTVREFTITDHGIEVASSGSSAESVLADVARISGSSNSGEGRGTPTGDEYDHNGAAEDTGR